MIRIDVHHLLASLTYLAGAHKHLVLMRREAIESQRFGLLEIDRFREMRECASRLGAIATALDMPAARAATTRLIFNLDKVAPFHICLTSERLTLLVDKITILALLQKS